MESIRSWLRKNWLEVLLIAGLAVLAFPAAQYLKRFIEFPFPLEYREASNMITAAQFHRGENPYLPDGFPGDMYVYGWLFPAVVAGVWNVLQPAVLLTRAVSAFGLGCSALFLFGILRREKASLAGAVSGALILVYALCVVSRINGARPDTLALALSLAGLYAATATEYSWKGLTTACLLWLGAFYLKQYLVLPVFLVGVYLFLFHSKSRAFGFAGIFSLLLLGSVGAVRAVFPAYFRYAFLHYVNNTSLTRDHLVWQFSYFLEWFAVLCVFLIVVWHQKYFSGLVKRFGQLRVRAGGWRAPLLEGIRLEFWDLGVVLIVLVLVFFLGRHEWNVHVYFLELLLPFVVIAVIPSVERLFPKPQWRLLGYAALLSCLLPLQNNFQTEFPAYAAGYRILEKRLDHCDRVLASPLLAAYLSERGATVYDTGASGYGFYVLEGEPTWLAFWMGGEDQVYSAKWQAWQQEIREQMQSRRFDCIAVENTVTDVAGSPLDQYYQKQGAFHDILDFDIIVWVPKPVG